MIIMEIANIPGVNMHASEYLRKNHPEIYNKDNMSFDDIIDAMEGYRNYNGDSIFGESRECEMCVTWIGNKRYKFCPDCGRQLIR